MPARSGDWTSVRNRVSRSVGSAGRAVATAPARRALKVRSSIYSQRLSADWALADSGAAARAAVVVALIPLDQGLHADGVALAVAVTDNRVGPAAGFNQHVRQHHPGVDLHRRDVR